MIKIQNIYYMLSYAFKVLNESGYKNLSTEEFPHTAELFAAILSQGVAVQVKRGLGRDYVSYTEALSCPRGKIEVSDSLKKRTLLKRQLVCQYDDFTTDSAANRVLKATMLLLLKSDISCQRKKQLRSLLLYFRDVSDIDVSNIDWHFRFDRNNQTYRMLIAICYLTVKGLLQTQIDGSTKLMDFMDEQRMHRLYEKFILEYYRKEFPDVTVAASQIPWVLDTDNKTFLPIMQSDIMLTYRNKTLIIDAKYYEHTFQSNHDKQTFHSGNLYQIFTYVKNKQASAGEQHQVSGMLLYAQTEDTLPISESYVMSGNKIGIRSLDLNQDFTCIRAQLDLIAESSLGVIRDSGFN